MADSEEPIAGWLSTDAGQVFCWFHPPKGTPRDLAVLLCDPLGSDRMNLHLTYRHLAILLSERGIPVLRLDYPGTCDSEGSSRDAGRLPGVFTALHAGADHLKACTGVSRLALCGVRFGGTLAAEFAARRQDVAFIALWGAYETGSQYLRRESAFDRMSGANPDSRRPAHWQEGDQESGGFLYTADFVEGLTQIVVGEKRFDAEVLIADWDEVDDSQQLVEHLRSAGHSVTTCGLIDRGSHSQINQTVPTLLLEQVANWFQENTSAEISRGSASIKGLKSEITMPQQPGQPPISERVVRFGARSDLFAVLTTPQQSLPTTPRAAVLLVNGGNNHRVGINRNYTEWARRWASSGFSVLRMDIRGLGDSPPLAARDLNRLYMERTVRDVQEAANWLRDNTPADQLIACGYCAGAYQVLSYARRGGKLDGLLLIELLRYYPWEPLQIFAPRWKARINRIWTRFHPLWLRDRGRIGRWLHELANRGTRTLVLYREDERSLEHFKSEVSHYKVALAESGIFELRTLSSSNHIISPLFAQEELSEILASYLQRHW